jgi:KDO2-lipid IV(A) lauroyltransferase
MITFFRLLSWVPLWLMHTLGWLLGWMAFLASKEYRRLFLENTRNAGLQWSQVRGAVGHVGQMITELPRLWFGRPVAVRIEGGEHVERVLAAGKGLILLTPHMGCFEVCAQAYASQFGQQKPITVLYRPSRQKAMRELVAMARNRPGLRAVAATTMGVRPIIEALRNGETVGMLPDQVPPKGQGVWVPFFGRDAYTVTLPARLSQQTGAGILLIWGERLSWGRGYVVRLSPLPNYLPEDRDSSAAAMNTALEQLIKQRPNQYLWSYERYKQPRDEAR